MVAVPHSQTGFFYESTPSHFEFVVEKGKVTGMNMYQNAAEKAEWAKRTDEPLPAERKIVKVDAEILNQYVGTYKLDIGMELKIALEGKQLTITPSGEESKVLAAYSDTEFSPEDLDAVLTFQKDDQDKVVGIQLEMDGQKLQGKRK